MSVLIWFALSRLILVGANTRKKKCDLNYLDETRAANICVHFPFVMLLNTTKNKEDLLKVSLHEGHDRYFGSFFFFFFHHHQHTGVEGVMTDHWPLSREASPLVSVRRMTCCHWRDKSHCTVYFGFLQDVIGPLWHISQSIACLLFLFWRTA